MDKIRIKQSIWTRAANTEPWYEAQHASLRLARKANRGNFTPCLDKPSQLPKQVVPVPESAQRAGEGAVATPANEGVTA